MNPEIKEDWVEALRSGEFYQTSDYLDTREGQCCLGVLCDILDVYWELDDLGNREYLGEDRELPYELKADLGIPFAMADELMEMNDAGVSFKQLADYIEAKL